MKKIILLSLFSVLLLGCGKDKSSEPSSSVQNGLEGIWQLCSQEFDSGGATAISSVKWKLNFAFNGGFESQLQYYKDTACSVEDQDASSSSGRFTIGNQNGEGITDIDMVYIEGTESGNPEEHFDIYRVSNGKLFFGKQDENYDASSVQKRPIELDFETFLSKPL